MFIMHYSFQYIWKLEAFIFFILQKEDTQAKASEGHW